MIYPSLLYLRFSHLMMPLIQQLLFLWSTSLFLVEKNLPILKLNVFSFLVWIFLECQGEVGFKNLIFRRLLHQIHVFNLLFVTLGWCVLPSRNSPWPAYESKDASYFDEPLKIPFFSSLILNLISFQHIFSWSTLPI